MKLNIIVAVASDGAIGRGGDQPFFISADLRRFKALTMGHPIIMGRKTFQALPRGPLPGLRNIVISRNPGFRPEGAETVPSLDAALALLDPADEPFVIGGGSIYALAMPLATSLHVTHVHTTVPDADTHFPPIDPAIWQAVSQSPAETDPATGLSYTYTTYSRKN